MRDRIATYCPDSVRSRVGGFACLALCCALAGCGSAPADPVTVSTTELDLRDGEQPVVQKQLSAGAWLLEVREAGVDVRAIFAAPGLRTEPIESTARHGVVYAVVSLDAPAEVRVTMRSVDHHTRTGRVSVRIARFTRAMDAAPGDIELGYRAWASAGELRAQATPEAWVSAADKLHEAITYFEAADDDAARAGAAYTLARLQYSERDDYAAAIRATEIAADSYDEVDDAVGVQSAATLRAAAELELASGMNAGTQRAEQRALYEAADRRLAEAGAFFTEQEFPLRAAYAINMRGIGALNVGDNDKAAEYFSRAVAMSRANHDVAEQARSQANLAWVRRLQGFVSQAAEEYAALLPLLDPERQAYQYGVLLNNYGFCLIALGDFDRALALHTEALDVFTRMGDENERATQLAALGALYFRVGDPARSLETLRAAIIAQEKLSDTAPLASTLRVAGNAAATLGQHDLALEYLRRSVRIDANQQAVNRTRVLVASELRIIGDHVAAEAELAAAVRSENRVVHADALAERARLRVAQKNPAAALADLRAADKVYAALGLEFSRIETNAALAQLLLAANELPGAAQAADEAVAIVQRLRINSANPEWRARFLSAQYAPFEARVAVDLAMGGQDVAAAYWRSFRTADQVRARSLSDQLAVAGRETLGKPDAEEEQLRASLTAQQLRLEARVQRQDADEATTAEVRRSIEETRAKLDARRAGREAVATSDTRLPESLRLVQEKLPAGTAVLAYFVGDSGSHAWLLAKDRLRHVPLAPRANLQRAIDATSGHPPGASGVRKAEAALSRMLFGDLLDDAPEDHLLIIPDGPLNGVPFAALPLPGASGPLLLDRFLIGYAPSLALVLATPERQRSAATRVAVVADPVYAADDRRLPTVSVAGNLRGARVSSPNKLTRLPHSALEARAVLDTFGRKDTVELAGFDATPRRVLELASANLAVLHFATHAVARKDSPERSALFLSEYTPDGTLLDDSQLTAGDIMRSGLSAQVVVLSGCATGDGSTLRGEGVLGLTYGFLANGAGSVVASLWPVEDATTARFMNEFYRAYRATGRATQALRTAQLRTRGNPSAALVWSSFVVRTNGFP